MAERTSDFANEIVEQMRKLGMSESAAFIQGETIAVDVGATAVSVQQLVDVVVEEDHQDHQDHQEDEQDVVDEKCDEVNSFKAVAQLKRDLNAAGMVCEDGDSVDQLCADLNAMLAFDSKKWRDELEKELFLQLNRDYRKMKVQVRDMRESKKAKADMYAAIDGCVNAAIKLDRSEPVVAHKQHVAERIEDHIG